MNQPNPATNISYANSSQGINKPLSTFLKNSQEKIKINHDKIENKPLADMDLLSERSYSQSQNKEYNKSNNSQLISPQIHSSPIHSSRKFTINTSAFLKKAADKKPKLLLSLDPANFKEELNASKTTHPLTSKVLNTHLNDSEKMKKELNPNVNKRFHKAKDDRIRNFIHNYEKILDQKSPTSKGAIKPKIDLSQETIKDKFVEEPQKK